MFGNSEFLLEQMRFGSHDAIIIKGSAEEVEEDPNIYVRAAEFLSPCSSHWWKCLADMCMERMRTQKTDLD